MANKGMLVNKQHFCDIAGISKYQFEKYVSFGMPVHQRPVNKQDEYLVFAGDCIAWMMEHAASKIRGGAKNGEAQRSFEEERIRLTAEQADSYALKNAVLRAELLPAPEVTAGWQAAVGRSRAMLLGIATASASRLVQLVYGTATDVQLAERKVREHLTFQIDAACVELQNTALDEPEGDEDEDEIPGERAPLREFRAH